MLLRNLASPETKAALPLALLKALMTPFLASVIPRLFLIIFRYSQPPLIKSSIKYVKAFNSNTNDDQGFWLVGTAVIVYVGFAVRLGSPALLLLDFNTYTQVSTSVYQHSINRAKLMTRSALVGLIHHKAMESPSIAYDDSEAVTLMSTDAGSLDGIAGMIHETWAQVIEVLIGIILLAREVGWVWPLPLVLIYCKYVTLSLT